MCTLHNCSIKHWYCRCLKFIWTFNRRLISYYVFIGRFCNFKFSTFLEHLFILIILLWTEFVSLKLSAFLTHVWTERILFSYGSILCLHSSTDYTEVCVLVPSVISIWNLSILNGGKYKSSDMCRLCCSHRLVMVIPTHHTTLYSGVHISYAACHKIQTTGRRRWNQKGMEVCILLNWLCKLKVG